MMNTHARSGRALLPVVSVLILLLAGFVYFNRGDAQDSPAPKPVKTAEIEEAQPQPVAHRAGPTADERTPGPNPSARTTSDSPGGTRMAATQDIKGIVVDTDGSPLPSVGVSVPGGGLIQTGPDGRFRAEPKAGVWQIRDDSWAPFHSRSITADGLHSAARGDLVLVAAPRVDLSGRIVGEGMDSISGARVSIRFGNLGASFSHELEGTELTRRLVTTDLEGSFSLGNIPYLLGSTLTVKHPLWAPLGIPLDAVSRDDLVLRLRPLDPATGSVTGFVLGPDGRPADGVEVRLGNVSTNSAADGSFQLEPGLTLRDETALAAIQPGVGFALIEGFGATVSESDGNPAAVQLRLTAGGLLDIRGRVVEVGGARDGSVWRVQLLDPTELSIGRVPPITLESLSSGALRGVQCASDGSFVLSGLADREYRLVATDPSRLLRVETASIAAGTADVQLRVSPDDLLRDVAGRVVTSDGVGVSGVRVQLMMRNSQSQSVATFVDGPDTETAGDGSFQFQGVPRRGIELMLSGDSILPTRRKLDSTGNETVLEVKRRVRFVFDASNLGLAVDHIRVFDANGRGMPVWIFTEAGWRTSSSPEVVDHRSETLAVGESAAEIVWYGGGSELGRRSLHLTPDRLTEFRP